MSEQTGKPVEPRVEPNSALRRLVFLDLETTGGSGRSDRVTEVALIVTEDGVEVSRWQTLVNPECAIPPDIAWLTGISNAMVASAPRFAEIAATVHAQLDGAILVAHNARFDYGFLKGEFARLDQTFAAKTLCTVRLARALFPEHHRHNLDTLIERFSIDVPNRHRAMGDTEAIVKLVSVWRAKEGAREVEAAMARVLKRPSLPKHLPLEALSALPKTSGVYLFYGVGAHPLYIGKAKNLRERVAAHFTGDYLSETDTRLAEEIRRIEVEETAGEWGALLRESALIKALMPARNALLRKKLEAVALRIETDRDLSDRHGKPVYTKLEDLDLARFSEQVGFFASKRGARAFLADLAKQTGLCAKALGLEKGTGPCFSFQLKRCQGWCVGSEDGETHLARTLAALEAARGEVVAWHQATQTDGALAFIERSAADVVPAREDWHVFDQWCYLGTVQTHDAAHELAKSAPRSFELDAYRLAQKMLARAGAEAQGEGMEIRLCAWLGLR